MPLPPAPDIAPLRTLWSSFFGTIALLVGVTFAIDLRAGPPPEMMALGFFALGLASMALFWAPRQFTVYPTLVVIRCALAEAIALNGFVLRYMGGSPSLFYAFIGLAVVVLLLTAPSTRERDGLLSGGPPTGD